MTTPPPSNSSAAAPSLRVAVASSRPVSRSLEAMLRQAVTVDDAGEPVSRAEQIAERLVELATDPDPTVSLRAMSTIMDRVEGRPNPTDARVDAADVQAAMQRAMQIFMHFVPDNRRAEMSAAVNRVLDGMRKGQ